jgi:hypothetical protein
MNSWSAVNGRAFFLQPLNQIIELSADSTQAYPIYAITDSLPDDQTG